MKPIKKIILIVLICVSIPIGIFGGMLGYYALDNYLEDYYCVKSGGLYYDTMFNTCAYETIIDGEKTVLIPIS